LATKEALVKGAEALHKGDPIATAMAVANTYERLMKNGGLGVGLLTPGTRVKTVDSDDTKIARDTLLSMHGGKDSLKKKEHLLRNVKHLLPFPGPRCRTDPDAWSD